MKPSFLLFPLFLLFLFVETGQAQRKKTAQAPEFEESHYNSIQWRLLGPFRGGRAGTVTGVVGNPNLYYMGTAGGGVWKSGDSGNTWECISDGYFGGSIGAVAVSESDPNVIYNDMSPFP